MMKVGMLGKEDESCLLEVRVMKDRYIDRGQGHSLEVGQDLEVGLEVGQEAGRAVQAGQGQDLPADLG